MAEMTRDVEGLTDGPPMLYLQPDCCADPAVGRVWCDTDEPGERCEEGVRWTPYVRADRHDAEIRRLRSELEEANKSNDRLYQDRYDLLNLTTAQGLSAAEWQMRTAKAEGERKRAEAERDEWIEKHRIVAESYNEAMLGEERAEGDARHYSEKVKAAEAELERRDAALREWQRWAAERDFDEPPPKHLTLATGGDDAND